MKRYYQKNKDRILTRVKLTQKLWYEKNKDRIKKREKEYYQKNKERISQYQKEYRALNRERITANRKIYNKEYYNRPDIKQKHKEYYKKYYIENKDAILRQQAIYLSNPENMEKKREYNRRRLKTSHGKSIG